MAFLPPRWPPRKDTRAGTATGFSPRTSQVDPGAAASENNHRDADNREDGREETCAEIGQSQQAMQEGMDQCCARQEEPAMTMKEETDSNDRRARAQSPPGAGPGYGFYRGRRRGGLGGANVPSLQRQERQKQDCAPSKVTEAGRWLVALRLSIQPRNYRPD